MQPAPSTSLAPPPIPAMPQLSEKPHQGFATKKTALHPASSVPNFRVTLGLRAVVVENGVREIYRARYYNPATGRFLSVDPLADEGQRRYQYAAANPVDGMDPNGSEDLIEYALVPHIFPPVWIPNYCAIVKAYANGNEELIHDLGCGPAPRLKKTVKVCSRPLLKGKIPGIPIYPLGHWHHTYIEIDTLDDTTLTTATWGVLGENGGKNQEVIPNDSRDSLLNGGGCDEVPCINSEASTLTNMLNATVYPGSTCPSCGANYHNWWWRQPPDGNNSNTYTYNMIYNWGKNPPTELNAPGYHYSSGYAGYN
jgi:hypothetical protein